MIKIMMVIMVTIMLKMKLVINNGNDIDKKILMIIAMKTNRDNNTAK